MFDHVDRGGTTADVVVMLEAFRDDPTIRRTPASGNGRGPDGDGRHGAPWDGNLVPMPPAAIERMLLCAVVALLNDRRALLAYLRRLDGIASTLDDGVGIEVRMGADRAARALRLLHVVRPVVADGGKASGGPCTRIPRHGGADRIRHGLDAATLAPSDDEHRLLRLIGRACVDAMSLRDAVSRLSFFKDAFGLGLGMDPILVEGVSIALDASLLLYADNPSTAWAEKLLGRATIRRHQGRCGRRMGALLALLVETPGMIVDVTRPIQAGGLADDR